MKGLLPWKSPLELCSDDSKFVTRLNELLKRMTVTTDGQQRLKFSSDQTQSQEATLFRNNKVHSQSSQCKKKEETQPYFKANSFGGNHFECDENRRMSTTGFPNKRTEAQGLHRRVAKEEPGRSTSHRLPIPNCEKTESRDYKAITAISSRNQAFYNVENKALNDQAADASKAQPP